MILKENCQQTRNRYRLSSSDEDIYKISLGNNILNGKIQDAFIWDWEQE